MPAPTLVLLPGLDGTGLLFDRLLRAIKDLDPGAAVQVVALPVDQGQSYEELSQWIAETGLPEGQLVLVAESFSGPLALLVAERLPDRVAALVLAATFVSPPLPLASLLAPFVGPWALRASLLSSMVPRLLLGSATTKQLLDDVHQAVRSVPPAVLAARLRQVLQVDASDLLARVEVPVIYLHANHDALLGRRAVRQVQSLRSGLAVVTLDAPHLVLQTRPRESAQAIVSFMQSLGFGGQAPRDC